MNVLDYTRFSVYDVALLPVTRQLHQVQIKENTTLKMCSIILNLQLGPLCL